MLNSLDKKKVLSFNGGKETKEWNYLEEKMGCKFKKLRKQLHLSHIQNKVDLMERGDTDITWTVGKRTVGTQQT